MSKVEEFIQNAINAAKIAVKFDQENQIEPSIYYYESASNFLEQAIKETDNKESNESLNQKSFEYRKRVEILKKQLNEKPKTPTDENQEENKNKSIKKQCYFLLQQAVEEDEHGDRTDAIELYAKAVEYITQHPELLQAGELKQLVLKGLERAEVLKGIKSPSKSSSSSASRTLANDRTVNSTATNKTPKLHRGPNAPLQMSEDEETYSQVEIAVLLRTSKINGIDYVPFMSIDLNERFQYSIPFTDRDGHLTPSPKQRPELYKFARLEEISSDPCIVKGSHPNYLNIKQTVISDCSFVASLAVSANHEAKFGKKLVTSIIYPQSKDKKPIYNPFGKYMIKLHINGIPRKIIIDDEFPINKYGQLLCSYSSDKNEFWISLLEKAYMKVMGGYDFPGSNSNIDLHTLTGWIPERAPIRNDDPDFNKDSLFNTLESRMAKGDVLVTVATGELSSFDADRSGLVATHAYAVMDVKTVKGVRLMKLKNPWSHLRWRGNYSELDTHHWTPELQNLLNYDPSSAAQFDNGVFWIDYESVLRFFEIFYMNWNPELFKYTYCVHRMWHAGEGPVRDLYSMAANPQFALHINSAGTAGAVWILLSRHITDIEDFRNNKEFITISVYKNGKKIYYPYEPPPYIEGVKINSPHYVCKIILNPDSCRDYTIIVSQYEKSATIYYTLRAYSTMPFTLNEIKDQYTEEKQITGEWKGFTAGGCPNHPSTYPHNPKFRLDILTDQSHILIELKGPKQYQMGIEATIRIVNDPSVSAPFKSKSSGPYRSGYVILALKNIPAGIIEIIPSTFLPQQEGPFIINVKSSGAIKLNSI